MISGVEFVKKGIRIILMLLICLTNINAGEDKYHFENNLSVDGIKRYYTINLPKEYEELKSLPVIIAMHGGGGSAEQCEKEYDLNSIALPEKFAVVYPEGVRGSGLLRVRTWNAGTCCEDAVENNINDVKFISNLIGELIVKYKIDPRRVYLTGMSNGAMMAYRLACEISEKIAAIAVVSGTMTTTNICKPNRAVPILHIHSERDKKVPPTGGKGIRDYYFPSIDSTLKVWAEFDKCSKEPLVEKQKDYTKFVWKKEASQIMIEYYLTKDGGHSWPGSKKSRLLADKPSKAIDANSLIVGFFKKH